MCILKSPDLADRWSQPSQVQANRFSPVCVSMCFRIPAEFADRCSQPSQVQADGFSPVCLCMWTWRFDKAAVR